MIEKGKWKGFQVGESSGTFCKRCGDQKVIYAKSGGYGQLSCPSCVLSDTKRSRKRNPVSHYFSTRTSTYRARAKRRGLECDLTREYLESIATKHCPVLGTRLIYGAERQSDNSASLDRIDNSKGYVEGNVVWLSDKANRMKNNATPNELRKFAKWVADEYGGV